jgi:hypothetical protein
MLLHTGKGGNMASRNVSTVEKAIRTLKQRLVSLGDMRPGTLSVQFRNPAERKIPFNQISYTYKGRSRSEYVRPENLYAVRREIEVYKRFKSILSQLIDLSIRASRIRCSTGFLAKKTKKRKLGYPFDSTTPKG